MTGLSPRGAAYSQGHAPEGRRPDVNDAQSWTLIAGFFTLMVTMIALTLRTVKAEIAVLDRRLEHLDSDVQMIINRLLDI
jgi:hypothetical protein